MRVSIFAARLGIAAAVWAANSTAYAAEVTEQRLQAAASDTENWLHYGRDYTNQRFSPLAAISTANVKRLVPKWIYQTGIAATFQTSPVVADGVMYLSTPFSNVVAVDALTGKEIWRYEHQRKSAKLCCGPANRGVAIGYGKIYVATVDARLVALEQTTGKVLWDITLAEQGVDPTEDKQALAASLSVSKATSMGSTGVGAASAPLIYDGKVIIGITGVGYGLHLDSDRPGAPLGAVIGISGKYGRPGFLAAFDAATGAKVWQFDSTQAGWEGAFSAATPDGMALPRDIAAEKASTKKYEGAWHYGGGSTWHTPALDTATNLLYFGIGNPSPQADGESRPGDNLFTSSLVALDAKTGKLVWHYQQVPHDLWGYDVASPPVLYDAMIEGRAIAAVAQASKLGWVYVHDRSNGKLLFKSDAFVPQENLFAAATPGGTRIAPGVSGGANWSPVSLDAKAQRVYVAGMHMPTIYKTAELPAVDGKPAIKYAIFESSKEPNWGTLTALDLANKGHIVWQQKTNEPLIGGVLATAGGLVFSGEGNGDFAAFDAATGAQLWRFNCGAGVNAPPIAYRLGGKDYIAVAAGGSQIWGFPQGDAVMVFGLPGEP